MVQGVRWSGYVPPKLQADATLSQDDPVSGTKYTVLDTISNVRVYQATVRCTWTVQPTPIEIHLLIDSIQHTAPFTNPVTATLYQARQTGGWFTAQSFDLSTADNAASRDFLIEGRTIKVEAEITGGTVSNLSALVKYALW